MELNKLLELIIKYIDNSTEVCLYDAHIELFTDMSGALIGSYHEPPTGEQLESSEYSKIIMNFNDIDELIEFLTYEESII